MSKLLSDALPSLYQGVDKASVSYKLLSSMGWREGEGLGANKQGIAAHVRVKKKMDVQGLGAAEEGDRQRDWTTGMVHFDQILSSLKEVTAKHDSGSDAEGGEAAKAKAAPRANEAKARKAAKSSKTAVFEKASLPSAEEPGSSRSTGDCTAEEPAAKRAKPEQAKGKLTTHVGRYSRRESAKKVRGYSSTDLAAILGTSAAAPAAAAPLEVRAAQCPESSGSSSAGHAAAGSDREGDVSCGRCVGDNPSSSGAPDPPKSWWMGLFVRAGRTGNSSRADVRRSKPPDKSGAAAAGTVGPDAAAVAGFSERDQEQLYTQVHQAATHGKQGLGISGAPKKVAGARWCGSKVKLGSDSEGEEEDEDGKQGLEGGDKQSGGRNAGSNGEPVGLVVVLASRKEKAQGRAPSRVPELGASNGSVAKASGGMPAAETLQPALKEVKVPCAAPTPAPAARGKVRWKKLARGVLKQAPKQRLRVHALRAKVMGAAGLHDQGSLEKSGERMLKKLRSCPDVFEVGDRWVRLL